VAAVLGHGSAERAGMFQVLNAAHICCCGATSTSSDASCGIMSAAAWVILTQLKQIHRVLACDTFFPLAGRGLSLLPLINCCLLLRAYSQASFLLKVLCDHSGFHREVPASIC
jgi:hypothetical protein